MLAIELLAKEDDSIVTSQDHKNILDRRIRPLALAYVKNQRGQILLHKLFDSVKNETFYRPLGGGIEFQESGHIAVEREILEEIDKKFKLS
jgi:NADH pyrophosphatase NudC (nudix superfamily)